jgi:hypothetical protein
MGNRGKKGENAKSAGSGFFLWRVSLCLAASSLQHGYSIAGRRNQKRDLSLFLPVAISHN